MGVKKRPHVRICENFKGTKAGNPSVVSPLVLRTLKNLSIFQGFIGNFHVLPDGGRVVKPGNHNIDHSHQEL